MTIELRSFWGETARLAFAAYPERRFSQPGNQNVQCPALRTTPPRSSWTVYRSPIGSLLPSGLFIESVDQGRFHLISPFFRLLSIGQRRPTAEARPNQPSFDLARG